MKNYKGITLVALVITIIILLILAGITIAQLSGNGLFENAQLSKEKSTRAEMVESLTLALQEIQVEKKGKATINDITQEWVDSKLTEYKNTVTEDAENNSKIITMEKDGITVNYILNEKLGLTESKVPVAKFKIEITDPIVSTNTSATVSDAAGKLSRGTACYINFTPSIISTSSKVIVSEESEKLAQETIEYTKLAKVLDEVPYTITPEVPYKVLGNGTYNFTVTATYDGATVTEEVKVNVNQYVTPTGYVQYDAGEWTKEEIEELQSKSLYDINISKTRNGTFKLKDSAGLNFTFGGFTYKGDTSNSEAINSGTIIMNRNLSVVGESGYGTPKYDGWQIMTTETKTDENGNTIKNQDGTDRIYITKITHAGSPENFVCYGNAYQAEYLLSNGERRTTYNTLSDGTVINPRNWDMYRDKELNEKGYIKEVHAMTGTEASATSVRNIGKNYWLASCYCDSSSQLHYTYPSTGQISGENSCHCWGIRPVVQMNDGVYIASGDGTAESPYVLGKE